MIIEFPTLEKAIAAHDSPAYQEALKALATVPFETFGSLKAWSSFRTQSATIRAPDHQIMLLSEAVRAHRLIEEGRVKGVRPADVRKTGQ